MRYDLAVFMKVSVDSGLIENKMELNMLNTTRHPPYNMSRPAGGKC